VLFLLQQLRKDHKHVDQT